jgi:hypothetical protein
MNKVELKYLVVFLAGLFLGVLFGPKAYAQANTDSTALSTPHLRTSSNTSEDQLTLTVVSGNKNLKIIKIFDIIGNEVKSIDLSSSKQGTLNFILNVSHLENGIYLCNLYSDKGIVETKKIYWSK